MPEPPVLSLPDQLTMKLVDGSVRGSGLTLVVGGLASIVTSACLVGSMPWLAFSMSTWSVVMVGPMSKLMSATFLICVPVGRLAFGSIVKLMKPIPAPVPSSGGRKPVMGFAGGRLVVGSIDCNEAERTPVSGFKFRSI